MCDFYQTEFKRQQELLSKRNFASAGRLRPGPQHPAAAQQKLASLSQQLAGIAANLERAIPTQPIERHPRYQACAWPRATRRSAPARPHGRKAPFDGIVTNVPSLQPGQYLAAATPAFSLVSTDHVWVEASPKETELTYVRPGQTGDGHVDTYPGRGLARHGRQHQPGVGSSFSLLPAQNTTGNWVKVVQRIPMRVRLDDSPGKPPLRVGMSVERRRRYRPCARAADLPDRALSWFGRSRPWLTPRRRRRGRQSRRHHRLRDPRRDHAGARHDDRQCGAALYPGQRLGERRPDQLGADLLHRGGRHHDAALGLPRQPVRPQARPAGRRSPASSSPRCSAASRSRCPRSSASACCRASSARPWCRCRRASCSTSTRPRSAARRWRCSASR